MDRGVAGATLLLLLMLGAEIAEVVRSACMQAAANAAICAASSAATDGAAAAAAPVVHVPLLQVTFKDMEWLRRHDIFIFDPCRVISTGNSTCCGCACSCCCCFSEVEYSFGCRTNCLRGTGLQLLQASQKGPPQSMPSSCFSFLPL